MHSDWFNGIEILQGRWWHGGKVGYRYRSGLEKTLCKWDIYVPLVTKGLTFKKAENVRINVTLGQVHLTILTGQPEFEPKKFHLRMKIGFFS
jgi:hypothetical protein